jgi:uncharacterized protein
MNMSAVRSSSSEIALTAENVGVPRLFIYFVLAYLGTWLTFAPLIFDPTLSPDVFAFLFVLSTFTGPTLAALVVTGLWSGRDGVRRLLGRLFRWRIGIRWYAAALFSFMVVWFGGYSIALDGSPIQAFVAQPQVLVTVFLPFILMTSLLPALGEEIGWRGFALPHLQKHFGPVLGTVILGLLHSLWHLPAFFTPVLGPFEPLGFLSFVLTGIAGTFIYTWIFNNARQSLLIAVLIHAAGNGASVMLGALVGGQMPTNATIMNLIASGWFNPILFWSVALILIIATRGRLSYRLEEKA